MRNPRYGARRPVKTHKYYSINSRIQADTLRVIDTTGAQLGVLSRDEALNIARERDLDIVLIAERANPPVAKITDFKKFLYEQEKKEKEAKKGAKKSVVKDIKISLFIGQADLDRLLSRTKEFLDDGNQVRLNLTLKGREIVKKDMAFELMKTFISGLGDINLSKEPRMEGRVVRAVVARKK